jgi:transcription-repair coupling factor (superfamily II helicase)
VIFDRYHKFSIKGYFTRKESITLKELTGLNPGDYVVHIDHGIGRFGGLEKIEVNGKIQEAIRLVYKDNDILYVPIHSLHRISKYKSGENAAPRINKLGSGAWQKLKESTNRKVKDIAKDLITLYASRLSAPGYSFSQDSYLQRELEASFIYEDTPDQLKTTNESKERHGKPHRWIVLYAVMWGSEKRDCNKGGLQGCNRQQTDCPAGTHYRSCLPAFQNLYRTS